MFLGGVVNRQAECKEVVACVVCILHGYRERGGVLAQHNTGANGGQIGSSAVASFDWISLPTHISALFLGLLCTGSLIALIEARHAAIVDRA